MTSQPPAPQRPLPLLPLAVVTMTALALEVFLTRLLAYVLPAFLLYLVLGVALLGFGAAGSLSSWKPAWFDPERAPRALAAWAIAFPVSLIAAYALFIRLAPSMPLGGGLLTFAGAFLLTVPFLAAGAVVTIALSSARSRVGVAYGADLLGSGVGCFLPLTLLGPLTGERFLGLLALSAWVGALLYARSAGDKRFTIAAFAALPLCLFALGAPRVAFPVVPEPFGQVAMIEKHNAELGVTSERLYDRWNPIGRVEVYQYRNVPGAPDPYPFRFYAQDNTAGAIMAKWDGKPHTEDPVASPNASNVARLCGETLFSQAYFRERRKVLVIGVGGGVDVQCALYNGAEQVDAVEINPDSIAAIRKFDDFVGGIGSNERVTFHIRDGRSFAKASRGENYDSVQLSGVDTKHVLAAGSLQLAENHLYTYQAFRDYLESLAPHGVISLIRFGEPEALRLANTAAAVLRELGAQNPEQHILINRNGHPYGVVVRRQPFPKAEIDAYRQKLWFEDRPFRGARIIFLDPFHYAVEKRPQAIYEPGHRHPTAPAAIRLMDFVARDDREGFAETYPFNVEPSTDDHPFFFDTTRYDRPEGWAMPHIRVLSNMLTSVLLLAALLLLLPVWSLRKSLKGGTGWRSPLYFGGVGLGFLFVEIWFLHRFAMFLGHQAYAMGVVLATMLVASGIGSLVGPRYVRDPGKRSAIGVAAMLAVVLLGYFAGPAAIDALWESALPTRILLTIAFTAPAAFAMGLPFPAGLAWVSDHSPNTLPWCIGINFFASVLATTAAIPLALFYGYGVVLSVGLVSYVVVALVALTMRPAEATAA